MPDSDSILLTLNLKEPNIHFDENYLSAEMVKGVRSLVYTGTLRTEPPDTCPVCGCVRHGSSIVRWGTKASMIVLPQVSRMNTYLRLRKQRWRCRDCGHTFSSHTDIVRKNCFISENTRLCIILDAKLKKSQQDIASSLNVSHGTVNRLLQDTYKDFIVRKNYLPRHLCFDEFKSVRKSIGHMSFLFLDAEKGSVIDVLEDRRLPELIKYFSTYTRGARNAVQTVCMDMYTPYRELVRKMFPNAKIIIDRFHIIQLISRSLNQTRTAVMKQDSRHYRKFKRYWKLILKNEEDLDNSTFKKYICFKHMIRETDVVHYLVSRDPQLQATYELYQDLLNAIKHRNADRFFNTCHNAGELISGFMKKTVRSLLDHEDGIRNALSHTFSNGVIEGTNNLIKVIKRIAFGYRSFVSFKIRILLITNTLVRFHNKRRGTFLVTSS